jgi:hypothetical protein
MGLFQSKSVQPQLQPLQPIVFAPKIVLNFSKTESKKETLAEQDDRLKHTEIIFDSKKIKHHTEEQLR